jgi:transcriptional regulator with XRE-family HTH domain
MGREVPEISIAGDVLEMRRRGAGLSLAALAARVGVSKAALHRYERGRVPSWAAAEKLREFVEEGEMPTCAPTSSFAQVRAEMAPAAGLGVVRRDAMALSQFLQEGSLLLGAASDRARQLAVDRERLADPQMRRTRVEELRRYAKTTVQGVSGRCTALVQWLDEEWSGGAGQR